MKTIKIAPIFFFNIILPNEQNVYNQSIILSQSYSKNIQHLLIGL